jgi:3-hydroxybutyryl-CoA dehydrogenase
VSQEWVPGEGRHLSVVGTGLMGAGIAELAARQGLRVVLHGRTPASLARAERSFAASRRRLAEAGRLSEQQASLVGQIHLTTRLDLARHADIVVESVAESLPVKRQIFQTLAATCPEDTLLASNTSAIPITDIAVGVVAPDRVVGTHFFSPVPSTRLCEIVRGSATSQATVARAVQFARSLGKSSIVVDRDVAGFVTTRLVVGLMLEAARLVESGVSTADGVDTACRLAFGHPVGPLALADRVGLDVLQHAATIIHEADREPGFRAPEILRALVSAGHLGRKSGRGFHTYEEGS